MIEESRKKDHRRREVRVRVKILADEDAKSDGREPLDAECVMRELGSAVIKACPQGVNFHAARTVVESILSKRQQIQP
ncbi:hypothetical protein Tcan_15430 [Toxocara canis]|uniref:Uncharacterized protein n=1 Tax=Toxocara canis TaxID=6265 RepID=A0A0B2VR08_TOXCA|nr:hypothetical protein Tcan_15430 [Toxocara canis]